MEGLMSKILIVDDETQYAYILDKFFSTSGFEVVLAFDGAMAIELFKKENPDIICLDIMMPKMNGYEVAKKIREISNVPIIMMSALSDEQDILKGFDLKIDDYVTKPFRTPILIAKVKAILERRYELEHGLKETKSQKKELAIAGIKLNTENLQCTINGEIVKLTKTECKLLEYLIEHAYENCTRETLYEAFWEGTDIDSRIIDTYIKKLRKLVDMGGCEIITVFGIGYRLEERKQD